LLIWAGKLIENLCKFISLIVGKAKLIGKLRGFIGKMWKDKLSDKPWKFIAIIILEIVAFGLAFCLVGYIFPAGQDIYNAIVIIFIFAVGITVMIYGNDIRNRRLTVLGFLIFLVAVFTVIYKYEEFAVKISAFAALAVAFAAFAATEENRRIRGDSVERESRDRKERLVDEVAKWLREIIGSILPKSGEFFFEEEDVLVKMPEIDKEAFLRARAADLAKAEWDALDSGIREAEYYQKLASQINEELSGLIEVVVLKLIERMQLHVKAASSKVAYVETMWASKSLQELIVNTGKNLEDLDLSDQDIIVVGFGRNARAIRNSVRDAINKVIELKVSFVVVK
jgi:predicted RNA-binding protein Jag